VTNVLIRARQAGLTPRRALLGLRTSANGRLDHYVLPSRRSLLAGAVSAVVLSTGVILGSGGVASAHNVDELLQQVYVTPTVQGLAISVEMTPGSQVAPGLLALIDTDGDQTISVAEAAAHTEVVRSSLEFQLEGQLVTVRSLHATYPDVPLLLGGGGTIILDFATDIPIAQQVRNIGVTNRYAPTSATSGAMLTKVQANLTPDAAVPVTIESMTHEDDGRTLGVRYTPPAAPTRTSVITAMSTALPLATSSGQGSTPSIVFIGLAAVVAVAGFAISARRRNTARA
jgi:hypothetical protein